jgi:antirestriction protein
MTPRAAIGCLSCYNNGVGNWKWLEADEANDLSESGLTTTAYYSNGEPFDECTVCEGDEFWCFDVEGVIHSTEMSVTEFLRAAELSITVHSHPDADALLAFLRDQGLAGEAQDIGTFNEVFMGTWNSAEEYVENFLEETGILSEVPESLRYYIAVERLTYDMLLTDIYTIQSENGMCWVFLNG